MSIHLRHLAGAAFLALAPAAAASAAAAQATGPNDRPRQTLASPVTESYPDEAVGDGVTAGGYNQSRWAEDWSKLRDPKKRRDALDRLKFIPFDDDGDVYLTLSGELRLRSNITTNPDLRERERQRQDINRIVGGADLHVGPHFRFYGEVAHAGISGPNIGQPSGLLRNDLTFQQYFGDVETEIGNATVGVRYGRQTFADGPNLLVVPRDNNTIFFTFNGVRAWARTGGVRFDAFDFRPTLYGQGGTGDDVREDNRRFSGVSAGIVVPQGWFGGSKLYVDPFVWRLRNDTAVWGPRTAREVRNFYGLHVWGDAGPVNLDWTINYQGGSYDNRDLSAWLILLAQSYKVGKGKAAPRIGVHADYASGGGGYGTGTLRNSLAPFGNNIYYSYQLYATPTNLMTLAPNVSFQPLPKVRLALEYQFSWRDDVNDAVYRANGAAFAGTQNFNSRKVAETARAQVVWSITPRLSFTGRYEHLKAGAALTDAGYRSSDFIAGWLSFRF